ncbi:hypothetical protein [Terrabacter carboxydivorans]|uniref:Uncharacterized protein n=1 Tax=Terrabacter carboxydivorans TaxID=619730 RepID=A0ABN3M9D0_9MICO
MLDNIALTYALDADTSTLLGAAREARNFIAHEGGSFSIHSPRTDQLVGHLENLRESVRDLAEGDNFISALQFELTEDAPFPTQLTSAYVDVVDAWVFYPVRDLIANPTSGQSRPGDGRWHGT